MMPCLWVLRNSHHASHESSLPTQENTIGENQKEYLEDNDDTSKKKSPKLTAQAILIMNSIHLGLYQLCIFCSKFGTRLAGPKPVNIGNAKQHIVARHNVGREVSLKNIERVRPQCQPMT